MAKFIIECDVTATVRERWSIEADTAEQARELFEEAEDGQSAEFVSQEVTGDEEDRCTVAVYEDTAPAAPLIGTPLERIAARIRGEWFDPMGDLESDIAAVLREAGAL